jgi:hypothetical protein
MCFGSSIQGRKARAKATRSSTATQNRYSRGSPVSANSPHSNSTSTNRLLNGTYSHTVEEYSNGTCEGPWIKHEWCRLTSRQVATTINEGCLVFLKLISKEDFTAQSVCKYCKLILCLKLRLWNESKTSCCSWMLLHLTCISIPSSSLYLKGGSYANKTWKFNLHISYWIITRNLGKGEKV